MNSDFNELIHWFRANKLSLNLSKTNYILFKPKHLKEEPPERENLNIKFEDVILEEKKDTKFLGIIIDEYLNWNQQCNSLHTKLSKGLYILRSTKKQLPSECLKTLYYSFIYCHITRGILLWGLNTYQNNLKRLTIQQKKSIRHIMNAKYNAHTHSYFKDLEILKLTDIIEHEMNKFTYSFNNHLLPVPLLNLFEINKDVHSYETRRKNDPRPPMHKSTYFNKSFLNKCPTLWSSLSPTIKDAKTRKTFTKLIKCQKIETY